MAFHKLFIPASRTLFGVPMSAHPEGIYSTSVGHLGLAICWKAKCGHVYSIMDVTRRMAGQPWISSMPNSLCNVSSSSHPILGNGKATTLEDRYELGEELGFGLFAVVRSCSDKVTGEILACKSIDKQSLVTPDDVQNVKMEIEIMKNLCGHSNVVDLKGVFEEEEYVHLVMELCEGGELFQHLQKQGRFSELGAAKLFSHLMKAVKYCHDNGVVHRDLKPENILLVTKSVDSPVKLADFGLATYLIPGQDLYGAVGSPFYMAPEVLAGGGYNQAVDVWSAGVILYILLSGIPPFWGKTKSRVLDKVREAQLEFPKEPWSCISGSAKRLICRMLCADPNKRLTSVQVLEHPWITSQEGAWVREDILFEG